MTISATLRAASWFVGESPGCRLNGGRKSAKRSGYCERIKTMPQLT